ncbi:hypothetical protein GCM10020229_20860 [Kitasatospora albolonga]
MTAVKLPRRSSRLTPRRAWTVRPPRPVGPVQLPHGGGDEGFVGFHAPILDTPPTTIDRAHTRPGGSVFRTPGSPRVALPLLTPAVTKDGRGIATVRDEGGRPGRLRRPRSPDRRPVRCGR